VREGSCRGDVGLVVLGGQWDPLSLSRGWGTVGGSDKGQASIERGALKGSEQVHKLEINRKKT